MNALSIFDFQAQAVRVVQNNGLPWFCGADVCRILGLGNASQAIKGNEASGALGLDEDEWGLYNLDSHSAALDGTARGRGGAQRLVVVSESGLYALIFKSRKAAAKKFRKWVTSEVLPAIRRQGRYEMEQAQAASARGQLVALRSLLLETAQGVKSGSIAIGKGQGVALLAQRYLETLKIEGDALGYEKVLGLRANETGDGILPGHGSRPPGGATAELLQGLPQPPVPPAPAAHSRVARLASRMPHLPCLLRQVLLPPVDRTHPTTRIAMKRSRRSA